MKSHGTGAPPWEFESIGHDVVIEPGALVFHAETITLGDRVYIGHHAIIKGYYNSRMSIGDGSWIGQQVFLHSGGGLEIGRDVGIGPSVKILTSQHDLQQETDRPIMGRPIQFSKVSIGDGSDVGVGAVILPGVELGQRVQVAAGAVVTKSFPDNSIVAGVPGRKVGDVP